MGGCWCEGESEWAVAVVRLGWGETVRGSEGGRGRGRG